MATPEDERKFPGEGGNAPLISADAASNPAGGPVNEVEMSAATLPSQPFPSSPSAMLVPPLDLRPLQPQQPLTPTPDAIKQASSRERDRDSVKHDSALPPPDMSAEQSTLQPPSQTHYGADPAALSAPFLEAAASGTIASPSGGASELYVPPASRVQWDVSLLPRAAAASDAAAGAAGEPVAAAPSVPVDPMLTWEEQLSRELEAEAAVEERALLPEMCRMVEEDTFTTRRQFLDTHDGVQFVYALQLKSFDPDLIDTPEAEEMAKARDKHEVFQKAKRNKDNFLLVFKHLRRVLGGAVSHKTGVPAFGDGANYLGYMRMGKYDPSHSYIQVGASLAQLEELAESIKMPMPGLQENFHPFDCALKGGRSRFAHPQGRQCPALVDVYFNYRRAHGPFPGDEPSVKFINYAVKHDAPNEKNKDNNLIQIKQRIRDQYLRDRIEAWLNAAQRSNVPIDMRPDADMGIKGAVHDSAEERRRLEAHLTAADVDGSLHAEAEAAAAEVTKLAARNFGGLDVPECECDLFVPYQKEELVRRLIELALDNALAELDREGMPVVGNGLRELKRRKVLKDMFPLHYEVDDSFYRMDRTTVVRTFCSYKKIASWLAAVGFFKQSTTFISWMRDYFGEKVGMYFAFLHFYNSATLILALLGLAPALWSYLSDEDNPLVIVYCVVIMMWAAFYIKWWNRRSNDCAFEWNMLEYEAKEGEMDSFLLSLKDEGAGAATYGFYEIEGRWVDMTDFATQAKKSKDEEILRFIPRSHVDTSGRLPSGWFNWFGSRTKKGDAERKQLNATIWRYAKEALSSSLITTLIGGVLVSIVSLMLLKLFLVDVLRLYGQLIAGVANGITIFVLDLVYRRLAIAMTEWENHRTITQFEEKLTAKCFVFQFVNSYFSLFYIAFVKSGFRDGADLPGGYTDSCQTSDGNPARNCMQELSSALMTIILTRLAISFFTQRILPTYMTKFSLYRLRLKAKVWASLQQGLDFTKAGIKGAARGAKAGVEFVIPMRRKSNTEPRLGEPQSQQPGVAWPADDAAAVAADQSDLEAGATPRPLGAATSVASPDMMLPPPPPNPPPVPAPAADVAVMPSSANEQASVPPPSVPASTSHPSGDPNESPRKRGVLGGILALGDHIVDGVETAVNAGDGLVDRTLDLFSDLGFMSDVNKLSLEYQAIQPKYAINRNVLGTFNDYNELVIGFGYCVMFAAAFPIAPAITLGHNIIQSGTHGFKLLKNYQKPKYYGALDIGMFWYLLLFLTICSIGTNTAIICYTSSQLERYINDNPTTTERLATALILEHVFGLCVYMVLSNVSDFRPSLRVQLALNDQVKEVENAYAEHVELKRLRDEQTAEEQEDKAFERSKSRFLRHRKATLMARHSEAGESKNARLASLLREHRMRDGAQSARGYFTGTAESPLLTSHPPSASTRIPPFSGRDSGLNPFLHGSRVVSVARAPASATGEISPSSWEPLDPAERKLWRDFKRAHEQQRAQAVAQEDIQPSFAKRVSTSTRVAPAPAPAPVPDAAGESAVQTVVVAPKDSPRKPLSARTEAKEDPEFDINWDGTSLPAAAADALPSCNGQLRRVALFDPRTRLLRPVYTQSASNLDVFFPFEVPSLSQLDGLALSELVTIGEHKFRLAVGKAADSESVELTLRYVAGPTPYYVQAYLVAKRIDADRVGLYRSLNYLFRSHTGIGFTRFASLSELRAEQCYKPKHDKVVFGLVVASPKGLLVHPHTPGAIGDDTRNTPARERSERMQKEQTRLLSMSLSPLPTTPNGSDEEQSPSPPPNGMAPESFPTLLSSQEPRVALPAGHGSHSFVEPAAEADEMQSDAGNASQQQRAADQLVRQQLDAEHEMKRQAARQRARELLGEEDEEVDGADGGGGVAITGDEEELKWDNRRRRDVGSDGEPVAPGEQDVSEPDSKPAEEDDKQPAQPAAIRTLPPAARSKLTLPPLTVGLRSPPQNPDAPQDVVVSRGAPAPQHALRAADPMVQTAGRAQPVRPQFRAMQSEVAAPLPKGEDSEALSFEHQRYDQARLHDEQRAKQLRMEAALRDAERHQEQEQREREMAERLVYLQSSMPRSTRTQQQQVYQPFYPAAARSPSSYADTDVRVTMQSSPGNVRLHPAASARHWSTQPPPPSMPLVTGVGSPSSTFAPAPLLSSSQVQPFLQPHPGFAATAASPWRGGGGGTGRPASNAFGSTGPRTAPYGVLEAPDFLFAGPPPSAAARAAPSQPFGRFDPSFQEVRPAQPPSGRHYAPPAPPPRFW